MKLLQKSNYSQLGVSKLFNEIIVSHLDGYDGTKKDKLKSFFDDLQRGGCQSGMIGQFIYHSDCKQFYVDNIDELEEMKTDLEEEIGEPIKNRFSNPHYTFMCWLCFEEYCFNLYNIIFED